MKTFTMITKFTRSKLLYRIRMKFAREALSHEFK